MPTYRCSLVVMARSRLHSVLLGTAYAHFEWNSSGYPLPVSSLAEDRFYARIAEFLVSRLNPPSKCCPRLPLLVVPPNPPTDFPGSAAGLGLGCGWLWPDLGCIRSSWALRMLILGGIPAAIHCRCPPWPRIDFTHESPSLWSPRSNHHQKAAPDSLANGSLLPPTDFPGGRGRVGVRVRWLWPDLGCIRSSWALRMLILSGISAAIHSRCPPFLRSCFTHESPRLWSLTDEPRR